MDCRILSEIDVDDIVASVKEIETKFNFESM